MFGYLWEDSKCHWQYIALKTFLWAANDGSTLCMSHVSKKSIIAEQLTRTICFFIESSFSIKRWTFFWCTSSRYLYFKFTKPNPSLFLVLVFSTGFRDHEYEIRKITYHYDWLYDDPAGIQAVIFELHIDGPTKCPGSVHKVICTCSLHF